MKLRGSTRCKHRTQFGNKAAYGACFAVTWLAITVESPRGRLADLAHAFDNMPTSQPFQARNPAVVFA